MSLITSQSSKRPVTRPKGYNWNITLVSRDEMLQLLCLPRVAPDSVPGSLPPGGRRRGLLRASLVWRHRRLPGECPQEDRLLGGDDSPLQLSDGQDVQTGQQQVVLLWLGSV